MVIYILDSNFTDHSGPFELNIFVPGIKLFFYVNRLKQYLDILNKLPFSKWITPSMYNLYIIQWHNVKDSQLPPIKKIN